MSKSVKSKELPVWNFTHDQVAEKASELVDEGCSIYLCDPKEEKAKHGEGYKHVIHKSGKESFRVETIDGLVVLQK